MKEDGAFWDAESISTIKKQHQAVSGSKSQRKTKINKQTNKKPRAPTENR